MKSIQRKTRWAGLLAAAMMLALLVSCTGFFVNPTLTSIAIGPANLSLAPATSFNMQATGTYNDGSTGDVTGKALWSSTNQSVATFSTTNIGQLTAAPLANIPDPPGTTSVSASVGSIASSSITVNVCPVVQAMTVTVNGGSSAQVTSGATVAFTASAQFNGVTGSTDVTNQVTWNISNTSILPSISGGSGITTVGVDGTVSISATLCGFTSPNVTLMTIN
jgi:Bacterial Ig-like domain (group 2)